MTEVAIVTPFRPGDPYRERNWEWLRDRYEALHGWPHHVADNEGTWAKGAAVNAAVAQTDAAVLVLADADSYVSAECLAETVRIVTDGEAQWSVPHGSVYRLTEDETDRVLEGAEPRRRLVRPVYAGPAGGGILVVTRTAFDEVRGIDERFVGWGGEDVSFAWALETLVGPYRRVGGDLWHLYHPHPSPRQELEPAIEALRDRYREARYVPRLMRALVEHRDPDPDVPLVEPRHFWAARADRIVRVGPKTAHFRHHRLTTTDADIAEALVICRFANIEEVDAHGIRNRSPA